MSSSFSQPRYVLLPEIRLRQTKREAGGTEAFRTAFCFYEFHAFVY